MTDRRPTVARGLLVAALGIALLSAMDATVKRLGAVFPIMEVVMLRYAGAALWLALFIVLTGRAWPQRRYLGRHGLRAALMCLTAFLFFYAITHLPLAVATALSMSSPVYVAVLGVLVLKERVGRVIVPAVLLGLAGALTIIVGNSGAVSATGEASMLAWIAALLAPVAYASSMVLLKTHSVHEDAAAIALAQSAFAALIALPIALPGLVMPAPEYWVDIGLAGFFGALGYLFLIAALRHLPASVFGLVDYTALMWSAALGYLVFGEVPGASLWLGAVLIVIACGLGMRAARGRA